MPRGSFRVEVSGEFDGHQGAALEIDPELEPALHDDAGKPGHREHQ